MNVIDMKKSHVQEKSTERVYPRHLEVITWVYIRKKKAKR